MPRSLHLSPQALMALEALAQYQYLTTAQMAALGVAASARGIRNDVLPRLKTQTRPLVTGRDFGIDPQGGKLHKVYCLTRHGVAVLAEHWRCDPARITYPKDGVQFSTDYHHRVAFVDFHIRLRQWAEASHAHVHFFHAYFDKIGSQKGARSPLQSRTRIPVGKGIIIPDGIFRFQHAGKDRLCALEIHRGNRPGRVMEQLDGHITALAQGAISEHYAYPASNAVLSVHESEATLVNVRQQLLQLPDFEAFAPLFHFAALGCLNDISQGWMHADGSPSMLFTKDSPPMQEVNRSVEAQRT